MKLKSYNILFCLFSFLADKTNGVPLFVKYKLLLGTLIIGLTGTSAYAQKKKVIADSISPNRPVSAGVTCYKVYIPPKDKENTPESIEVKGRVVDKGGEGIIGVAINIKGTTSGVITDVEGNFSIKAKTNDVLVFLYIGYEKKEIPVSQVRKDTSIVLEEEATMLCYDIVVVSNPRSWDDIYSHRMKPITKISYNEISNKAVSPVGDLESFQEWVQSNIMPSAQMKNKVKGEVILSFAIDKKGRLVDKKVIGKLSEEADKEALRALSLSDVWQPGSHYDGKPIKTTMTISISFGDE